MDERRISVQLKIVDYETGCWTGGDVQVPTEIILESVRLYGPNVPATLENLRRVITARLSRLPDSADEGS